MGQKNSFQDIMVAKGFGKQGYSAGSLGCPGAPSGTERRVKADPRGGPGS